MAVQLLAFQGNMSFFSCAGGLLVKDTFVDHEAWQVAALFLLYGPFPTRASKAQWHKCVCHCLLSSFLLGVVEFVCLHVFVFES